MSSEWRHRPGFTYPDASYCGADNQAWPCDAQREHERAEVAEGRVVELEGALAGAATAIDALVSDGWSSLSERRAVQCAYEARRLLASGKSQDG